MASFRLNKVAKDFNVGIQTLVEYLAKKGHQVEPSPNTKISEEQYELLATAFQDERKVKEEADKIELMSSGSDRVVEVSSKSEPEAEPEEVIIKGFTAAKSATPAKPAASGKAAKKRTETPAPAPQPEAEEEPEIPETEEPEENEAPVVNPDSPFKVVGTVDLSAINQRTRPDKKKKAKKGEKKEDAVSPAATAKPKKKTEAKEEVPAEPMPEPEPVAVEETKPESKPEPKPEPEFIETQYQKLEGPKVLGPSTRNWRVRRYSTRLTSASSARTVPIPRAASASASTPKRRLSAPPK